MNLGLLDREEPTMTDNEIQQAEIACKLLGAEFHERKQAITRDLFAHAELVEELPDGFAYRFPSADPWPAKVLEFVAAERQCCPFFTFEIVFEPNDGPIWFRLRGSAEIKRFIKTELAPAR
jgi:hypothetical protein